jgi:serine/threonine protein kinase
VTGQAAEQIIAGVVLSERLAVTMYGAIHRAQFNGARNLRGLVIDDKLLAESGFRIALTDAKSIAALTRLDHPGIVPTVTVESGGPDVVVVTRGVGRYVSVQDLISAARAQKSAGGKLSFEIAAAIGKAVVEAVAAAHAIGVVHGAVHPRSVLIDEDGAVRVTDFVVGRALTTAVAQGADSSLWRGLAGYLAPELVVGEDPTPAADVFAVGAMMFTMLTGEAPPGALRATPAVERLVQRALDTDSSRRYQTAKELLENLLEAFEDDHWELAERGELIKAAGLSQTDGNIDDATEDLLASLGGPGLGGVQVTPIRPSMDIRAEVLATRGSAVAPGKRLDALLHDLDEPSMTNVDVRSFADRTADPISEIIKQDPRRAEAIVQADYHDDATPLPPPSGHDSDPDIQQRARASSPGLRRSAPRAAASLSRTGTQDEAAALDAISNLDEPVRRVATAADAAEAAAEKLTAAAVRAEAAARSIVASKAGPGEIVASKAGPDAELRADPTEPDAVRRSGNDLRRSAPAIAPPDFVDDMPPPKLKGSGGKLVGVLLLFALAGAGYALYWKITTDRADNEQHKKDTEALQKKLDDDAAARQKDAIEALTDPGAIKVSSNPTNAGVWLWMGKTPMTTPVLSAADTHEFGLTHDGYDVGEIQITADRWSTDGNTNRTAKVDVPMQAHVASGAPPAPPPKDPAKAPRDPRQLPIQSTEAQKHTGLVGSGTIAITSTPAGSDVWLYIGGTLPTAEITQIPAGRDYRVLVQKPGFKPKEIAIHADDWRMPGDSRPIDSAKKKDVYEVDAELDPIDPKKAPK